MSEMQEACPQGADVAKLPYGGRILGFKTRYFILPRNGDDPSVKDEQWISFDLGCFRLKRLETNDDDGARDEQVATEISLGESPLAVLSPPQSFVERDPLTLNKLHAAIADGQPF